MKIVHDAKGIAVQGLGNRNDIRYSKKGGWGGIRVKVKLIKEKKSMDS